VAGGVAERALLAPAGHPPVDQLRVALQALLGADPEALGDAGAEALDEDVGLLDQAQDDLAARVALEVDGHGALGPVGHVLVQGGSAGPGPGPVDPDHVGPQIGQQHSRERAGTDPRQFDHPHSGQWTGHVHPPLARQTTRPVCHVS